MFYKKWSVFAGRIALVGILWLTLVSVASAQSSVPPGLIMWNKLGSDSEVTHSEFGPNLDFYTGGYWVHVPGQRAYVPGKFGQAITLSGSYFSTVRVHNLVLNDLSNYIDPEQGTVEAWYYQKAIPVPYNYGVYRIFDGAYGLDAGMAFDVYGSPDQMRFALGFGAASYVTISYDLANIPNNEWIHVAAVWDRQGIGGSAETMRLYVNGTSVAASTDSSWGTAVGSQADIAGGNDANIADKFYLDNMRIWDYARTDFTFTEAPNSPPVAIEDVVTMDRDAPLTIDVLANDYDPDGDALTIVEVTQGTNGSVAYDGTQVMYTRNPDFNGTDTFGYKIDDGNGGVSWGGVIVTVLAEVDVDPTARLGYNVVIGKGSKIEAEVVILDNTVIGSDVLIKRKAFIGPNSNIGAGSRLEANVQLGGNARLAERVALKKDVVAGNNFQAGADVSVDKNTKIGNDVTLGKRVAIDKEVTIGDKVTLEEQVVVKQAVQLGRETLAKAASRISQNAKVGQRVVVGRSALVKAKAVVPDDTVIPDGGTYP
ncbi:MAG: cadherin-like domain-containing protein [Anaerolineales bacterium]|nr:cadherin-like domain-containing protein [Anaerolineales bacterium]